VIRIIRAIREICGSKQLLSTNINLSFCKIKAKRKIFTCAAMLGIVDEILLGIHPHRLLVDNAWFLAASAVGCVFHWLGRQRSDIFIAKKEADALKSHATALLWAICPLAILICMQGLVIRVAVAGINFK